MDYRRTRVVAIVFALLMSMTALLSLPMAMGAEPAETQFSLPPIAVATVWPAVGTVGDNVYVIGGSVSHSPGISNTLDSVQIYNIATGETTFGASMPTGVGCAAYGVGPDGKIYVAGGWNNSAATYNLKVQIYDPALNTWTQASGTIPGPVGRGAYAMAPDGNLYVFGNGWVTNSTLIYNTQTNVWRYGADQPVSGYDGSAVVQSPRSVYVIGGIYGGASAAVHVYNPIANTWSTAGSLLNPEVFGSAVLARNGYMYVIGGSPSTATNYASPYSSVERYNPAADEWEYAGTSLSSGRMNAGVVLDTYGRVLVVGGWSGSAAVKTVEGFVTSSIVGLNVMEISSPQDGSVVSGIVPVQVGIVNGYGGGFAAIDFFVDGALRESRMWGTSATFLWDTSALADGSLHTLMARGYNNDGTVSEASVVVTVSAQSVEQKITSLEQQVSLLQASLNSLNSSVGAAQSDIDALQTQLSSLQGQLNSLKTNQSTQSSTLDQIQTQLNEMKDQLDKVKTTSNSGSMWGMVNLALIIVVIVLLGLMLMMGRKSKAVPPPPST